jgi:uncharacterized protein (DUF779 family)
VPPGVINVVTGPGASVGMALASSKRIAKVAFTGETVIGRLIMQYAATRRPDRAPLGGCCDGSSPMCLRAADLPASPHGVQLGVLDGVPVLIDGDQNRRWQQPSFHLDVAPPARPEASRSRRWRTCTSRPRRAIRRREAPMLIIR